MSELLQALATTRFAVCLIVLWTYWSACFAALREVHDPSAIKSERVQLELRLRQLGSRQDTARRYRVAALLAGMGIIVLAFLVAGIETLVRGWGLGQGGAANSQAMRILFNFLVLTGLSIKLIPILSVKFGKHAYWKFVGATAGITAVMWAMLSIPDSNPAAAAIKVGGLAVIVIILLVAWSSQRD